MAESGDLLDIRFQDQTRYKKPSGIYWLQTAAIKIFSEDGDRKIWAQRLPSVLGALLAVIAAYWGDDWKTRGLHCRRHVSLVRPRYF